MFSSLSFCSLSVKQVREHPSLLEYMGPKMPPTFDKSFIFNRKIDSQRMVVFPALSNPNMRIRTSFEPKSDWKIRLNKIPILFEVDVSKFNFFRK